MIEEFDSSAAKVARAVGYVPRFAIVTLAIMFLLVGCAAQLSPSYNQAIFDDLTGLNVKTETLFASLSHDSSVGDFASRRTTYDELIGSFSAAKLTTEARDVPPMGLRIAASPALKGICGSDPVQCANPTPHHLEKIIALLTAMRDAHERGGLTRFIVAGSDGTGGVKNQYETDMNIILVFEAALQR